MRYRERLLLIAVIVIWEILGLVWLHGAPFRDRPLSLVRVYR
jgi:hypothetical protein